jgi:hypothetical protein
VQLGLVPCNLAQLILVTCTSAKLDFGFLQFSTIGSGSLQLAQPVLVPCTSAKLDFGFLQLGTVSSASLHLAQLVFVPCTSAQLVFVPRISATHVCFPAPQHSYIVLVFPAAAQFWLSVVWYS